jgi:Tol biopolymer transport system component
MTWYTHGSAQPRRVVKTFTSLAWSPDGRSVAFSSDIDPSGAFYVYTIPADGGEPWRIEQTRSAWPNQFAWRTEPPMHTDAHR